jgi:hypothetical protein
MDIFNFVSKLNKSTSNQNIYSIAVEDLEQVWGYIPYNNVKHYEIEKELITNKQFIDVSDGKHKGNRVSLSHHIQRIASLCNLIQNNHNIIPVIATDAFQLLLL